MEENKDLSFVVFVQAAISPVRWHGDVSDLLCGG
jgi:hypothetical protein